MTRRCHRLPRVKWVWLTKSAFRYSELDGDGNLLEKRRLADGQWRLDTDAMQDAIDAEEEAKRQCGEFDAEVELAEADGESDAEGDCVAESSDDESCGGDDVDVSDCDAAGTMDTSDK